MGFDSERDVQVLERTPRVLESMLSALDDAWLRSNYGPGTWSPLQIVAHFLHNELEDWIPRVRWILERAEEEPFPAYDPSGNDAFAGRSLDDLLGAFANARRESIAELRRLVTPETLSKRGVHPAFGSISMDELLCAWVTHDLHHVAQIAKALARQHREDAGPWREYISILG